MIRSILIKSFNLTYNNLQFIKTCNKRTSFRCLTTEKLTKVNYDNMDDLSEIPTIHYDPHKPATKKLLIDKFQQLLECTRAEAIDVIDSTEHLRTKSMHTIARNIAFLNDQGVTNKSILDNIFILEFNYGKPLSFLNC